MSAVPKPPPPKPRAGQHRRPAFRGRIEGLGSPAPASLRASTPTLVREPTPTPAPPPQAHTGPLCPNPDCPNRSKIIRTDQGLICESCGALVQEDSGLVSEQGFGETESGRIVAQGVQIGATQSHQKTYGAGGIYGTAGRETTTANERSLQQARRIMTSYVPLLGIQESEIASGVKLFGFACTLSFLQGRTIDSVAVVSLYIVCRRKKEQFQGVKRSIYPLMLIDFADKINMDVFALGKIYHDLYKKVYFNSENSTWKDDSASKDFQGLDPAVLIPRFVQDLEFDRKDEPKIRYDAMQILQRMKRDWIHQGRRPSGVVGAAVLLAARMNNYRRTTREVVLTAKVTEITISKRLEEFYDTQASNLSVTRFRAEADSAWLDENHPPILKEALNPKKKRKRGRPRKHPLPETAAEIEGDNTPEPQASNDGQQPPAKRVRVDAEGYKIPDIPARRTAVNPALGTEEISESGNARRNDSEGPQAESSSQSAVGENNTDALDEQPSASSQNRGGQASPDALQPLRRNKRPNWVAPNESFAERVIETGLTDDIDATMRENPEVYGEFLVEAQASSQSGSSTVDGVHQQPDTGQEGAQQEPIDLTIDPTQTVPPHPKDKTPGPPAESAVGNFGHVSLSPTLKPEEFDSDEDVSNCLLSEAEIRIKERVWVTMNADWLRKDHTKRIRKELDDAEMRAKGLDPAEEERKKKAQKGKRKDGTNRPGRRGDVSYLKDQREAAKKGKAPAEDGAEGEEGEEDAEGENIENIEGTDAGDDATPEPGKKNPVAAMKAFFGARGAFSRRINFDALEAIYGMSGTTSEESAESRSATGDGRDRSQSVAESDGTGNPEQNRESRESSVGGSAGPSAAIGPKSRKTSTPITPSAIFRGNRGRERKTQLGSARRERARRERNDQKRAGAAGQSGEAGNRSASRSRSASTPASEGEGSVGRTPEPQPRAQVQTQSQLPLPTPPATQLGPQMPSIRTSMPAAAALSTTTPFAPQLGPQIPGIRTTILPSTSASSSAAVPQVRATVANPSPRSSPQGQRKPSTPDEDEELEDVEEEDDESDEDTNNEADFDVEAAFEGRYQSRDRDGDDEDD